ncbi:hypothetical protein [Sphingomonas nostoxanthinifaciens]|uniref:hypothetical protein n=1 Tax=Sphingomonas nostoxanthinifaciens TaxID=2872652 RepID=UPI001CC1FB86|nr:hypothetical protein [Sphingomonas nostoxanthinifaciens]UAK24307.1 hypothetical protein K8P63_18645 [Sphingomonas nostoxanthinifaciens]
MTDLAAEPDGYGRVFGLIDRLVQSSDPRLRGNAVHALAALTTARDAGTGAAAQERLIELLVSEDMPSADTRWRETLQASILDALRQIPEDRRQAVAEETLARLRQRDVKHHSTVFAALMEAHASHLVGHGVSGRLSSWQWRAYGIGVIGLILRCIWRYLLLAIPMVVAVGMVLGSDKAGLLLAMLLFVITPVFALIAGPASRLGILGHPPLPQARYLRDTLIGGATIALFTLAATCLIAWLWTPTLKVGPWSAALGLIGGFAAGALSRALRWPPFPPARPGRIEDQLGRVVGAVAIATLICAFFALLGFAAPAACVWIPLAPACGASAWLDLWLEDRPPEYPAAFKNVLPRAVLLLPIGAAILLIGYNLWAPASPIAVPVIPRAPSLALDLGTIKDNDVRSIPLAYGNSVQVSGGNNATFTINAAAADNSDIVLKHGPAGLDKQLDDNNSSKPQETLTQQIGTTYWLCVDVYGKSQCSARSDTPDGLTELEKVGRTIFVGRGLGLGGWQPGARANPLPGPNQRPDLTLTIRRAG